MCGGEIIPISSRDHYRELRGAKGQADRFAGDGLYHGLAAAGIRLCDLLGRFFSETRLARWARLAGLATPHEMLQIRS